MSLPRNWPLLMPIISYWFCSWIPCELWNCYDYSSNQHLHCTPDTTNDKLSYRKGVNIHSVCLTNRIIDHRLTSRPKSQHWGWSPNIGAQISASWLISQPWGLNLSLLRLKSSPNIQIPASRLKPQHRKGFWLLRPFRGCWPSHHHIPTYKHKSTNLRHCDCVAFGPSLSSSVVQASVVKNNFKAFAFWIDGLTQLPSDVWADGRIDGHSD